MTDKMLRNRLLWALLVKLALITLLWWLFVKDYRVVADSDAMAQQLTGQAESIKQGEPHGNQ